MSEVEPVCEYCGKPLSSRDGLHLANVSPEGYTWYLHEHPCLGRAKDWKALSEKARARWLAGALMQSQMELASD